MKCAIIFLLSCICTLAEPVKLSWDPYDEAAHNVVGFRVHLGSQPGVYDQVIDLGNGAAQEFILLGLDPGTYFLRMTAYNAYGLESNYNANEISVTVTTRTDPQPPAPVVNVQLTLEQSIDLRTWEPVKTWTQQSGNAATFWRLKITTP